MKRRLKNIVTALSALLCLAAIAAWGFGMAGRGFQLFHLGRGNWAASADGDRGGLVARFMVAQPGGENTFSMSAPQTFKLSEESQHLVGLNFFYEDYGQSSHGWFIILPCWFFISVFAVAPVLWLRRRFIERRQRKFFEEAAAAMKWASLSKSRSRATSRARPKTFSHEIRLF
jgi:hypothetical protein